MADINAALTVLANFTSWYTRLPEMQLKVYFKDEYCGIRVVFSVTEIFNCVTE